VSETKIKKQPPSYDPLKDGISDNQWLSEAYWHWMEHQKYNYHQAAINEFTHYYGVTYAQFVERYSVSGKITPDQYSQFRQRELRSRPGIKCAVDYPYPGPFN